MSMFDPCNKLDTCTVGPVLLSMYTVSGERRGWQGGLQRVEHGINLTKNEGPRSKQLLRRTAPSLPTRAGNAFQQNASKTLMSEN
jgi:hypothetical protein